MAQVSDFSSNGFFANDPDFKVVTRQGITIATPCLMPPPVRGPNDTLWVVPIRLQYRWDLVAFETLGDVALKHVLMRHNRCSDGFFTPKAGDRLLIPTADQIAYYLHQ